MLYLIYSCWNFLEVLVNFTAENTSQKQIKPTIFVGGCNLFITFFLCAKTTTTMSPKVFWCDVQDV